MSDQPSRLPPTVLPAHQILMGFPPTRGRRLLACLLLSPVLLLAACGWQMRGHFDSSHQLGKVYVYGDTFYGIVNKTVRTEIIASGGEVPASRSEADHAVWIGNEESRIRTASYDVLVRAVENELIMQVEFEVHGRDGQLIHGPERIYAERVYEYDVQAVTTSEAQFRIIEDELRQAMARQIVLRLAAINPPDHAAPEADAPTL